jgi:tetratricopeptide (TPR) repeat protein
VAYRVALDARGRDARRAARERPLTEAAAVVRGDADEAARREFWELIDGEVNRLLEKYRAAFVLCCFEGKSNADAARELRCPVGTVESRLTRARRRLRTGLARRGVTSSAGLLGAALAREAGAAVTPGLIASLLRSLGPDASVAPQVAALAQGALRSMLTTKPKVVAAAAVAVGVAAGAGLCAYRAMAVERPAAVGAGQVPPADDKGAAPEAVEAKSVLERALQMMKPVEARDDPELEAKVYALIFIGRAQAEAGDKDGAATTFRQALESAKGFKNVGRKVNALFSIAGGQALADEVKEARETLAAAEEAQGERLDVNSNFTDALTEIAAAEARAGDIKAALRTADEFRYQGHKARALERVAVEQARAKDVKGAVETAGRITIDAWRAWVLLRIGRLQDKAGDRDGAAKRSREALEALSAVHDENELNRGAGTPGVPSLAELAEVLGEACEEKAAIRWIESLKTSPSNKTYALVGLARGIRLRNEPKKEKDWEENSPHAKTAGGVRSGSDPDEAAACRKRHDRLRAAS